MTDKEACYQANKLAYSEMSVWSLHIKTVLTTVQHRLEHVLTDKEQATTVRDALLDTALSEPGPALFIENTGSFLINMLLMGKDPIALASSVSGLAGISNAQLDAYANVVCRSPPNPDFALLPL